MKSRIVTMVFLAFGALALAACGGSAEKTEGSAPGGAEPQAPAARAPAAGKPQAKPDAVETGVLPPKEEAPLAQAGTGDEETEVVSRSRRRRSLRGRAPDLRAGLAGATW